MALFFLDYDLRSRRDYQGLYDELKKFGAVRILESLWCFQRININAEGLREYFRQYIDADDGLIVSEINGWASYGVRGTPKDLK